MLTTILICVIIGLITIIILSLIITSHYYTQNKKYISIVDKLSGSKLHLSFEELTNIIISRIDILIKEYFITDIYPQCAYRTMAETTITMQVPSLIRSISSNVYYSLSKDMIKNLFKYIREIDDADTYDALIVKFISSLVNIQITDNISVFQNDRSFKAKIKADYSESNKEKDK